MCMIFFFPTFALILGEEKLYLKGTFLCLSLSWKGAVFPIIFQESLMMIRWDKFYYYVRVCELNPGLPGEYRLSFQRNTEELLMSHVAGAQGSPVWLDAG